MGQIGHPIAVTIASGGTAQRVVSDAASVYRFVPWSFFQAAPSNAGLLYFGDSTVSSSLYMIALDGTGTNGERNFNWNAFQYDPSPRPNSKNQNLIDLYNVWVDGTTGDDFFVTVPTLIIP